jgi:hypothetical protein
MSAPSDRDLAQRWLAEQFAAAADRDGDPCWTAEPCPAGHYPCDDAPAEQVVGSPAGLAAAILAASGAAVERLESGGSYFRLAILFPAQRSGVAAHQHTEEGDMSGLTAAEAGVLRWAMDKDEALNLPAEERVRRIVGAALVQSRYFDQDDEDPAAFDLLQWHKCEPVCPSKCGCSGVPYISDEVWRVLWPYLRSVAATVQWGVELRATHTEEQG